MPDLDHATPFYDLKSAKIYKLNELEYSINAEVYKGLPEYPGYYISRRGVVFSEKRWQIQRHRIDKDGYHKVTLSLADENGRVNPMITAVHRFLYKAWIGAMDDSHVVNHHDAVVWHNYPENYDNMTPIENCRASSYVMSVHNVEDICKMMAQNIPFHEIAAKYGYDKEKDPKSFYQFFARIRTLKYPKSARTWADISSKYDLSKYDFGADGITYKEYLEKYASRTIQPPITEELAKKMLDEYNQGLTIRMIADRHGYAMISVGRAIRNMRKKISTQSAA